PPPEPASAPLTASSRPAISFDDKWNGELANRPVSPAIANGIQQAEILEWALQAAAAEIEGVTEIATRRFVRGRSGTVVIEADFRNGDRSLEKREIALCNEGRGSPLAEEIRTFLRTCQNARPVLVRPRGGRLPRTGRFVAPL